MASPINGDLRKLLNKFVKEQETSGCNDDPATKDEISPEIGVTACQGRMTLYTKAYEVQVGCVLLRKEPAGTPKPTMYWFVSFTNSERVYVTTERECLVALCP